MATLRNTKTGMVISVADAKVERFGPEWEPAGTATPPAPTKPKATPPAKKPAAKK